MFSSPCVGRELIPALRSPSPCTAAVLPLCIAAATTISCLATPRAYCAFSGASPSAWATTTQCEAVCLFAYRPCDLRGYGYQPVYTLCAACANDDAEALAVLSEPPYSLTTEDALTYAGDHDGNKDSIQCVLEMACISGSASAVRALGLPPYSLTDDRDRDGYCTARLRNPPYNVTWKDVVLANDGRYDAELMKLFESNVGPDDKEFAYHSYIDSFRFYQIDGAESWICLGNMTDMWSPVSWEWGVSPVPKSTYPLGQITLIGNCKNQMQCYVHGCPLCCALDESSR
eukprot:m51a1_g13602 hypothetical protein (287) ;mRNA; r:58-1710